MSDLPHVGFYTLLQILTHHSLELLHSEVQTIPKVAQRMLGAQTSGRIGSPPPPASGVEPSK